MLPISQATEIAAMKTTIDISDALLREARKVAARHAMTLRALVEQGLRKVLAEKSRRVPFRQRKASFNGRGLRAELRDATWEDVRDLIYKGRGS